MNGQLLIALPKGRLYDQACGLLDRAHIRRESAPGRSLMQQDTSGIYAFIQLKPVDIPVYVETGTVDVGIVGTDILRELDSNVYEPLDLQIGKCRLVLAAPTGVKLSTTNHLRIATKYPSTALRYFSLRKTHPHIIRLEGSVEIAPVLGLADAIVDLVETGRTLKENGLTIVDVVEEVTARLIINRTSMKTKTQQVHALIDALDAVVYAAH